MKRKILMSLLIIVFIVGMMLHFFCLIKSGWCFDIFLKYQIFYLFLSAELSIRILWVVSYIMMFGSVMLIQFKLR